MLKDVIRNERKKLGLTQEKLAKLLNTTRQNVSNWETGYNIPSIELLIKLADFFEVSTDYLLGRTIYKK